MTGTATVAVFLPCFCVNLVGGVSMILRNRYLRIRVLVIPLLPLFGVLRFPSPVTVPSSFWLSMSSCFSSCDDVPRRHRAGLPARCADADIYHEYTTWNMCPFVVQKLGVEVLAVVQSAVLNFAFV